MGNTFDGIVTNVGVVADIISRTYEVKISAKNANLEIKPGMVCDVNLSIEIGKDVLAVPNSAVSKDSEGNAFVYVVSKDEKKCKKTRCCFG